MIDFPNNPTNGQIFYDDNGNAWVYDVDQWVSSSGQIETIAQFNDVEITNLQTSDGLAWDGTKLINKPLPAALPIEENKNQTSPKYLFGINASYHVLSNNVVTKTPFNKKSFDPNNVFNTTTNTFTVPVNGHYMLSASINTWFDNTEFYIWLYVNGVREHLMLSACGGGSRKHVERATKLVELSQNDLVDIRMMMNHYSTRGTADYRITETPDTEFSGYLFRKI